MISVDQCTVGEGGLCRLGVIFNFECVVAWCGGYML